MALGTDCADFIVDMTAVLSGISAYQSMIREAEKAVEDIEKKCKALPQSSWSGTSREAFDKEAAFRMNEIQKVINQMDATRNILSDLLKQANNQRKEALALKDLLT